jgi:Zn-dependent protease
VKREVTLLGILHGGIVLRNGCILVTVTGELQIFLCCGGRGEFFAESLAFWKNASIIVVMIRFRIFGIPVEIQPWFWLILALLGSGFGQKGGNMNEALAVALFVIAGAISILVHELGHALTGKYFKAQPIIVLHSFGGVAVFPYAKFTRMQSFLMIAAGPAIQILLGMIVWAIQYKYRSQISEAFAGFLDDLWLVSIFWAILNLIPVSPLDGGQMLYQIMGPKRRRLFLQVSIGLAILFAVGLFLKTGFLIMPIFLLYYAYQNFQELRNFR